MCTTMIVVPTSATFQDEALCGFIAATNIASYSTSFSMWTCDTGGVATTDPCTWYGNSCDGNGYVSKIDLSYDYISGRYWW